MVIGIISSLMAITVPAFNNARRKVNTIRCGNNLKEIARSVNSFSADHSDRYPHSVATIGSKYWNWHDPRRMAAVSKRVKAPYRAMSSYLREYISDTDLLYCPGAPDKPPNLEAMWEAGEEWHLPGEPKTSYQGTYCFYWNYVGLFETDASLKTPLPNRRQLFLGPYSPASTGKYSKILASDFFTFGNGEDVPATPPGGFASCEYFSDAVVSTPTKPIRTSSWGVERSDINNKPVGLQFRAVFTDTHVDTYRTTDVIPMWVILYEDRLDPCPVGENTNSVGIFYLPDDALPTKIESVSVNP